MVVASLWRSSKMRLQTLQWATGSLGLLTEPGLANYESSLAILHKSPKTAFRTSELIKRLYQIKISCSDNIQSIYWKSNPFTYSKRRIISIWRKVQNTPDISLTEFKELGWPRRITSLVLTLTYTTNLASLSVITKEVRLGYWKDVSVTTPKLFKDADKEERPSQVDILPIYIIFLVYVIVDILI